ncbi:MAG: class I SAM-dependent methyltransferase [Sedimentisphaerales bacterium]
MIECRKNTNKVSPSCVCQICEGQDFKFVCEKSGFKYVECASCGVVRQYPYPTDEEIKHYYRTYKSIKQKESPYLSDSYYETYCMEKKLTFSDLRFSLDEFKDKRVLDVGCAVGQFIQFLSDKGTVDVSGIDISEEVIAIAKVVKGLNCRLADFLTIEGEFDIITMWHLVEHLVEPLSFFEHAYHRLIAGGYLIVETPVVGIISRAFGENWRYLIPVEHVNLFSQNALFNVVTSTGFSIKSWVRFGSGNDSGKLPAPNKKAMDSIAKQLAFGDTLCVCFVK